jgi:hypothetical protein
VRWQSEARHRFGWVTYWPVTLVLLLAVFTKAKAPSRFALPAHSIRDDAYLTSTRKNRLGVPAGTSFVSQSPVPEFVRIGVQYKSLSASLYWTS